MSGFDPKRHDIRFCTQVLKKSKVARLKKLVWIAERGEGGEEGGGTVGIGFDALVALLWLFLTFVKLRVEIVTDARHECAIVGR